LDNKADINKQSNSHFSPLHLAIAHKQQATVKLILRYDHVSEQNIESGITLTLVYKTPEIRALLEMTLKSRRKVILLRLIHFRALLILNSPKRFASLAKRFRKSATSAQDARLLFIAARNVRRFIGQIIRRIARRRNRDVFLLLNLPFS
jgi:ankyrin repeat protein